MSRFVVGGHFFFFVAHYHRAALGAHHDFVFGVFHVLHGDFLPVAPCGKERRFVGEVGEIGAREAGRAARDVKRFDGIIERLFAHMHFEDLFAAFEVGQADHHLPVKTARAQQRGVEDVRAVGGGDDDDTFVAFKAVHFDEELVQRLFAFVVSATESGATLATNGVNFVDEDDAGRVFFRFFKHVAHARGTDADEHFHKIRAGDGEKRHFRLASNGARQQGFTGAGRADHEQAARNLSAEAAEFARVAQEFDHFHDVRFRFVRTGDIGKGDFDFVFRDEAGATFAERKRAALAAALNLAGGEHEEADEQQNRQQIDKDAGKEAFFFQRLAADVYLVGTQVADESASVSRLRVVGGKARAAAVGEADARILQVNRRTLHLAVIHAVKELRIADLARAAGCAEFAHLADEQQEQQDEPAPDQ